MGCCCGKNQGGAAATRWAGDEFRTGGGNAANSPRPTSKPTGQSRGSGPGDGNDGNGTESESLVYAIDRCFDRRALRRRDTVFTQVHADRRRAPSRLLNGKTTLGF